MRREARRVVQLTVQAVAMHAARAAPGAVSRPDACRRRAATGGRQHDGTLHSYPGSRGGRGVVTEGMYGGGGQPDRLAAGSRQPMF